MHNHVRLLGHPAHPMFIVFPLGLFATAVVFDILYLILRYPILPAVSFYMIAAGIVGGLIAAVFGFLDWMAVQSGTRAKRLATWHGIGNFTIVVLFVISWLLRLGSTDHIPGVLALILSFLGAGMALVTAWLGGEMVYRLGVAVDQDANPNARSSLS